jgi:hypothetical protein
MRSSRQAGPLEQAAAEAVRNYLDALRATQRPTRRHLTRRELQQRLNRIDLKLAIQPPPMIQLRLVQEREDLRELAKWQQLEDAFVEVALTYSRRHRITHETWRQLGVPPAVLRRARIPQRRTPVPTGAVGPCWESSSPP